MTPMQLLQQHQSVGNPSAREKFPVTMPMPIAPSPFHIVPGPNPTTTNTSHPPQPTNKRPNTATGKYFQI
jgi:hypothetical protein